MNEDTMIERIRAGEIEISTLVEQLAAEDHQQRKAASTALSGIANDSPEQLEGFGEQLLPLLSSDDHSVRMQVSKTLISLVNLNPELGRNAVPFLEPRLDDELFVVRKNALSVLHVTAKADALTVEPVTEGIVDLLDSEVAAIRQRAVSILLQIGSESPASLCEHVGSLVAHLDEQSDSRIHFEEQYGLKTSGQSRRGLDPIQRIQQDERVRIGVIKDGVALLLATIAETDPTPFEDYSDVLITHLDNERLIVRKSIAEVAGFAGDAGVIDSQSVASKLVEQLTHDPSDIVRGRSAWALGLLSERDGTVRSEVADAVEENLDLFESDNVEVKIGITTLLATVVDSHPEVAEMAHSEITALLDSESTIVRQHAVYVLGTLNDDRFSHQLERIRNEDLEPDVADLAASFLAADQ